MKAAGIVVEYNPFHNGHLYHAQQAKKQTGADVLIAVMSGQFLQRGEPAFADKWTRSKMALASGVDLVIELPYVYATAQATDFAKGSIAMLDALRCESFCFGSEEGDIHPFLKSHQLLDLNRDAYEQRIHEAVQTGISYPKALNDAYRSLVGEEEGFVDLTKPNNILGFHYIEAARKLQSPIKPLTIKRMGANYHDPLEAGVSIASATGIREAFFEEGSLQKLAGYMPEESLAALNDFHNEHGGFGSWERFYPLLRYTILKDGPARLADYAEVTEGIENLIFSAAKRATTFETFIQLVKSKRYTRTRIQRMLTHIYTGFTWQQLRGFKQPGYLRLLGMTKSGRSYLNQEKKNIQLPIISRTAELADPMGKQDVHASQLYMLGIGAPDLKKEFSTAPIYFG